MEIHPLLLILALLVMGSAFGLVGALIATPATGFVVAFVQEFYLAAQPKDPKLDQHIERVLERK